MKKVPMLLWALLLCVCLVACDEPTTTTQPTKPTASSTEPSTVPTEPSTVPAEPTAAPTEPTASYTEPATVPTEPVEPSTAPTNPKTEMVWIPKTGEKYHTNSSCSNMKDPSQVTKEEAESRGYEPCKRCH